MNTALSQTLTILTALFMSIVFTAPLHALERPLFLDEVEETGTVSSLSESQKEDLRLYLTEKSLEEADNRISVTSLGVTLERASYIEGHAAELTVSWDSLMAPEVLQYAKDISTLSLTAYLTSSTANPDNTLGGSTVHCTDETTLSFPITDKHPTLSLPIIADCPNPEAHVTFFAPDGHALGFWTITEPKVVEGEEEESSFAGLVFGVLLVVGILGFVFTRFNDRGRKRDGS
jgi:hypothetical protein